MTELLFWLAIAVAALLSFRNWRHGFALCVLIALVQDPVRKLVTGQPLYFVVLVGVVFAAAWLGALLARVPIRPVNIIGWRRYVGLPFALFLIVVLLQAGHSLFRFGNPTLTGIGLMSYLAPIPAIVLAYRFALSRGDTGLRRWMRFYVVVATAALATVYLEFSGASSRLLGEVGGGVMISGQGAYYKGNAGTFRAAEIAAWHAATVACFSFMLAWGRRFSLSRILIALAFIVFLLGIGALTGRRKMIIEIAIFLSAYFCLVAWFQRGSGKLVLLIAMLGFASYFGAVAMIPPDPSEAALASERAYKATDRSFAKYSERASTVFAEAPQRALALGVQPVGWAVASHGWMGAGVGTGSQGAQRFGVVNSGAAEGGLGKVTMELGVPGLILTVWLFLAFVRYSWRVLVLLAKTSPRHANFAYGFVSFMLANMAAFLVATQAYGDVFILLTLGWSFGFLIALPVLAARQLAANTASTAARGVRVGVDAAAVQMGMQGH